MAPPPKDGHILDLVVSRTTDNMVQSCEVGSFDGDHNAIYITMNCCKPHPIRKEISFRKIRSINSSLAGHAQQIFLLYWMPGQKLLRKGSPLTPYIVTLRRPLILYLMNAFCANWMVLEFKERY